MLGVEIAVLGIEDLGFFNHGRRRGRGLLKATTDEAASDSGCLAKRRRVDDGVGELPCDGNGGTAQVGADR